MNARKKVFIILLSVFVFLVAAVGSSAYFLLLHRYKGTAIVDEWRVDKTFDPSAVRTLKKTKGKDLVILNLADVQMCDLEDIPHYSIIHDELTYLVETVKPDLITLTGDQTWSNENLISLKTLIGWLDGYKIPYAPVFGNHDHGNDYDSAVAGINYCCDLYENGKYSLFSRGPSNLGALGNYVIAVEEDGVIVNAIYMLDAGYTDVLTDEQIAWVRWNADGLKNACGGEYLPSLCFMHKPVPEFGRAYYSFINGESTAIGPVSVHYSLSGTVQNGFFSMAKEIGVTDIVCGHQHGNDFTIEYEGVRLTFALKTGELGGYYGDEEVYLNGASAFKVNGASVVKENVYVEKEKYGIE